MTGWQPHHTAPQHISVTDCLPIASTACQSPGCIAIKLQIRSRAILACNADVVILLLLLPPMLQLALLLLLLLLLLLMMRARVLPQQRATASAATPSVATRKPAQTFHPMPGHLRPHFCALIL
ncbi:GD19537 [Drosophila simulans]|uniref:GD19537 n=1 Tax=Drosophila simulans TaxID=7240 RepID=B4QYD2_DROSI|nr:GD19537 [Drosophila simulans]